MHRQTKHPIELLPRIKEMKACQQTPVLLYLAEMNNQPQPLLAVPITAEELRCRELLAAIAKRDQGAMEVLYDITIGRAYGVALRITARRDAAEDVVAEVYWQVWQQADRYDPQRGSALGWLLTICRSRALDYLRRRDKAELHPEPHELRPELGIDNENPQDLLLAIERDNVLHSALTGLSSQQRQLIALAFFRGLSHQEIANFTGMPLGSVKTQIRKALGVLRNTLDSSSQLDLQQDTL